MTWGETLGVSTFPFPLNTVRHQMNDQPPAPPERKLGVYDRPASADRPRGRLIIWLIAIAVSLGWLLYFFVLR